MGARVDEGAVRNTKDVDILIRRSDFQAAKSALEGAGFVYHHLIDIDVFVDGPQGRPSEGIHLLYAGEPVQPNDSIPSPTLDESERAKEFQVLSLEATVRMYLIAWHHKDRMYLQDLIDVGQLDCKWPDRFPKPLCDRLQHLMNISVDKDD